MTTQASKKIYFAILLITLFHSSIASAKCSADLSRYVGWTIIYSGTVTGYITDEGEEDSSFNGCEYGRRLIVDYTKQVTCQTYSYSYAYHPDILILDNGSSREACIDGDMYAISN